MRHLWDTCETLVRHSWDTCDALVSQTWDTPESLVILFGSLMGSTRESLAEYWNAALRGTALRSGAPRSRSAVGAQLRKLPRSASRSATPKKAGALAGARAPTIMQNKIRKWLVSRKKISRASAHDPFLFKNFNIDLKWSNLWSNFWPKIHLNVICSYYLLKRSLRENASHPSHPIFCNKTEGSLLQKKWQDALL